MLTTIAVSAVLIYFSVTALAVLSGLGLGFIGSLQINGGVFSWKFLEDLFSLCTCISVIGLFWPLMVIFVGFLAVKYVAISQIYSPE